MAQMLILRLKSKKRETIKQLKNTSGGRVVAGSNPVTPT